MATTPTYVPVVPYADSTFADAYFADRTSDGTWENSSASARTRALNAATTFINSLSFVGYKNDVDQVNEFPRNDDAEVPQEVCQACCEMAAFYLRGGTIQGAQQDGSLQSESIGGVSRSYAAGAGVMDANFGIPSPEAARLLAPWLRDLDTIRIERVS